MQVTTSPIHPTTDVIVEQCRRLIAFRHHRQRYFDRNLFDEFAWDMLLHLFIAKCEHRLMSDEQLMAEVGCSLPVAMRWLAHLEKEGDIHRRAGDGDTVFVTIDEGARDRLHTLMTETLAN